MTERSDYFDRQGNPISLLKWAELHRTTSYRFVEHAVVVDYAHPKRGFQVSTIWVGHDLETGFTIPPFIFETTVFRLYHDGKHSVGERMYQTEAEARAGHAELLDAVQGDMDEPVVSYPLAPWVDVEIRH